MRALGRSEQLDESAVLATREDLERARLGIDDPVLRDTEGRAVSLLLDTVAPLVARRRGDDRDHDVCGRSRQGGLSWGQPASGEEHHDVGLATAARGDGDLALGAEHHLGVHSVRESGSPVASCKTRESATAASVAASLAPATFALGQPQSANNSGSGTSLVARGSACLAKQLRE